MAAHAGDTRQPFFMKHPTGRWQSIAVPRLGEKVSRNTRKTFLGAQPKRPAAGGYEGDIDALKFPGSDYTAGEPMAEVEHKACRGRRPISLMDGKFLCWDLPSRAGCRCPAETRRRGEHEMLKGNGINLLIQMQLARRGGYLAGK